jgi:hypothetical protein
MRAKLVTHAINRRSPSLPKKNITKSSQQTTISSRKNFTVREGLTNNFWMAKLDTSEISTSKHVAEFVELWFSIIEAQLVEGTDDGITWKFTISGEKHSVASAYNAQFEGK